MPWELRGLRIREFFSIILLLGGLVFPGFPAVAQQTSAPPASISPSSEAVDPSGIEPPPAVPPTHRFWDHTNILLFSGIAVMRGMDYASTRNFQARGRQEILLPDVVVDNSAGFASLEAAATMTSVGISYIFHRTGHHKMERWLSIGHIGVTGFGDVRNYCLVTKHRR
ncbi:MAG: hypothetical protein WB952_12795 [Terriglobales bacterium]